MHLNAHHPRGHNPMPGQFLRMHTHELDDAVSLFSIMHIMALLRTNDFHRIL